MTNYSSSVLENLYQNYQHPWFTQLLLLESITTSDVESTQKPSTETTGRKCIKCGAKSCIRNGRESNRCEACFNFKKRHGFTLTPEDREFLGEPKCAICGTTEGKLCIDHCHTTNKIRGWLCDKHNRGIGYFDDDTQLMLNAINYLSTNN